MKRFILLMSFAMVARFCVAVGTVEIVLSYKFDGISHTDRLVLGVGGRQDVEYDNSSESYSVGNFEWSIPTTSGIDWRFGTERGYNTYRIGRKSGSFWYRYPPTEGGSDGGRLSFGETYQLDVSGDTYASEHLADVFVSSSELVGKKITNMTDVDITYGVGVVGAKPIIPKGSAVFVKDVIARFGALDSSWEIHSEQDWETTFTPITSTGSTFVSYDFPHFVNLVIYKPTTPPAIHTVAGALVYADMKDSTGNNLLYGASGQPLYSAKDIIDNFRVMTEWLFDSSDNGNTTVWINGELVCGNHTIDHIIPYVISASDNWRYDKATNCYQIDFTMQLQSQTGQTGYSVEQRCWIIDYDSYDDAPADKRASASVTVGDVSSFRATINRSTGEKKINLLQ